MNKDIYSIYESYLMREDVGAASVTNSEGGFRTPNQSFRPQSQGIVRGDMPEQSEENSIILKHVHNMVKCAEARNIDSMVFEFKKLGKLLRQKGYKLDI